MAALAPHRDGYRPKACCLNFEETGPSAAARQGHNPFVLVNYSPTICLNPPASSGRLESWPIKVGQEKRDDGRPASPHVPAVGRDPADRAWPYRGRAAAVG